MSIEISITTSADGLADISVDEYSAKVLEMIEAAYPGAEVDLNVEDVALASKVRVHTSPRLAPTVEADIESRVLDIVRVDAFEACCSA